jgi:hypothetical protein
LRLAKTQYPCRREFKKLKDSILLFLEISETIKLVLVPLRYSFLLEFSIGSKTLERSLYHFVQLINQLDKNDYNSGRR